MPFAITRAVSPEIGQRDHSQGTPTSINLRRATHQQEAWADLLERQGLVVNRLQPQYGSPDSCFVGDTAFAVDELAVLGVLGEERAVELQAICHTLPRLRELARLSGPAKLEASDVLRVGRRLFIGLTARTNQRAYEQVRRMLDPFGYEVTPVEVTANVHLTGACGVVNDETLLVNPAWLELDAFDGLKLLTVPEQEETAAGVVRLGDTVCVEACNPRTVDLLQRHAAQVETVDISELRKVGATLSRLAIIF